MAENASVPSSEARPGQSEQKTPAGTTLNYPDPVLANLKFTEACCKSTICTFDDKDSSLNHSQMLAQMNPSHCPSYM